MGRLKKPIKSKEPVHLRFRQLRNGNTSLYLDIYHQGRRSYEFLKLYLVPEKDAISKRQNEGVLISANALKAQRVIELSNIEAGITVNTTKGRMLLHDWAEAAYKKAESKVSPATNNGRRLLLHLLGMYGDRIPMKNISKSYCIGFIDFLMNEYQIKLNDGTNKPLSKASINTYLKHFSALLNMAVREDVIQTNPYSKIDHAARPQPEEKHRTFLTIDEVKKLIATPAPREEVKRIFLFSCFCGLRWSDASRLVWANLEENNGKRYINTVMKKTSKPLYIPINDTASSFLPPREKGDSDLDLVFQGLPSRPTIASCIRKWASDAGIAKNVTFHVSRHTFATTSLTLGNDLYTTSKLLGHSNVSTTQIYARIINEKKEAAVAQFDTVFK